MFDRIKLILTSAGAFIWPYLKTVLISLTPVIQQAAVAAVAITAEKYKGQLNSRADKLAAHEDAYQIIANQAGVLGIDMTRSATEKAIDAAIKAAVAGMNGASK